MARQGRRRRIALWWSGFVNKIFPLNCSSPYRSSTSKVAENAPKQEEEKTTKSNTIKKPIQNRPLKVVALCGSLRKTSYNRGLIHAAIQLVEESIPGMEIELVDTELPFINTDLEVDGKFPDSVEAFRNKVVKADCILFSSPEYNYSVSPVLKNAIDWASRAPNVMNGKPAAIMSVSGALGGARAQYHLRQIGVYLDLHFVNKPEVFVDGYVSPRKFDEQGNLIDDEVKTEIKELLLALQELAMKLL